MKLGIQLKAWSRIVFSMVGILLNGGILLGWLHFALGSWIQDHSPRNGQGWIANDQRVCSFLNSNNLKSLSTKYEGYESSPEESLPAQQFLAYLLALKDARGGRTLSYAKRVA